MASDFAGSTAEYYRRYRRDVPGVVLAQLCEALGLTRDDFVLDLGCGTGQVAVPLSTRVGAVIAVDPERDMLTQLEGRITGEGIANVRTVRGADSDLPSLLAVTGANPIAAVTIGTALHWMDAERVFLTSLDRLRTGGGVAVITQGLPIWNQDSDWSRELRTYLKTWLGPLTSTCGTDSQTFEQRRQLMTRVGFPTVQSFTNTEEIEVEVDYIIGNLYSAMSQHQIDSADRARFEHGLHRALEPHTDRARLFDHVEATMLVGRV